MIEENGRVVRVEDEYAWVETSAAGTCGGCKAGGVCGTPVLASLFGRRESPVRVVNHAHAAIGDRVVIGIEESGLLRGSLAVYIAPLAGLFAGALLGRFAAGALQPGLGEAASILGALAGMLAGLAWLRRFSRRTRQDARYQPVLLRVQATTS